MTLYYNAPFGCLVDTSNPIKVRNYGRGHWTVWFRTPKGRSYEETCVAPFASFDAAWAFIDHHLGYA